MKIEIDTDLIEELFPLLKAMGYTVEKRRFYRGMPPPFGNGVEITHLVTFDRNGCPNFPPKEAFL